MTATAPRRSGTVQVRVPGQKVMRGDMLRLAGTWRQVVDLRRVGPRQRAWFNAGEVLDLLLHAEYSVYRPVQRGDRAPGKSGGR